MAFCTECGHQLADGAKFCFECGAKVVGASSPRVEQRKTVYDGEIHRCPNCGDILDAYESVCKSCGYERRGTKATSSVQELAQKLEEIEAQRPPKRITTVFSQAFTQGYVSKTDEQKISLIQNFPIPNSREDIMEFAVMAISNVDPDAFSTLSYSGVYGSASKQALSNAWLSKFEQAYEKGRLMFGDAPELERMHALCVSKKKTILIKKSGIWVLLAAPFVIVGIILGIIAIAGGFS